MFNIKISLVTSSGLLLATKPESVDDTKQILATGLMAALISFSKEVHHRELQSISYHDRTVSFKRIYDFIIIVEVLTEEESLPETQFKQLLEHLNSCMSPLLETMDPNTITEGEAELILENGLQEIYQLQYSITEQPFTTSEKSSFKMVHSSKEWEIIDKEGSGTHIPKIALMLDTLKVNQKFKTGINGILTQIPEEKCCTYTIFTTDGESTKVGILKVPKEMELTLFRLAPLMKKKAELLFANEEGNLEYILTSLMDIEDPGIRLSRFNLEDLSPTFLVKTLGKNIDKVIYSAVVGDGILVVGDKPTVRLVIDNLSLLTQHIQTSVNTWLITNDLSDEGKCILNSRICGLSPQIYHTIKVNNPLLEGMIVIDLESGKVDSTKSSSYFSNLFNTIKKLKVSEMSDKLNQELEKLSLLSLTITSFALVDEEKGKQQMKELASQSGFTASFIKKALELSIKNNPLLKYLA